MATQRITWTSTIAGVGTDPSRIVLRDPTKAYGLRRTDTGEVIVAASAGEAVPMVDIGDGVFEYVFTGLADGVEYQYAIEALIGSNQFYTIDKFLTGGITLTVPTNAYATREDVEREIGKSNTAMLADLNNWQTDSEIANEINLLLEQRSRHVDWVLGSAGIALPLTPKAGLSLEPVRHAVALYVAYDLYTARPDRFGRNPMAAKKVEADAILAALAKDGTLVLGTVPETSGTLAALTGGLSLADQFSCDDLRPATCCRTGWPWNQL